VFLSEVKSSEPRFRLTYGKGEMDTVALKFEIPPPGHAYAFKTYSEAKCRRKRGDK
jgi:hypothetical protein